MTIRYKTIDFTFTKDDITKLSVDCIVNAANSSLLGGGGVDGAIHAAAGSKLDEECRAIARRIGALPAGKAVITSAGTMKTKAVIHTVGPIWKGGHADEAALLHEAYQNSLRLADDNLFTSIAFPCISTGIFGYPKREAAVIAVTALFALAAQLKNIQTVIFCLFSAEDEKIYKTIFTNYSTTGRIE